MRCRITLDCLLVVE